MARIAERTNKDGTTSYQVKWREGGRRDGEPQSKTFPDRKVAERFEKLVEGTVCDEGCPEHWPPGWEPTVEPAGGPAGVSLAAWMERWLASLSGIETRQLADYRRILTTYAMPYFDHGRMAVAKVSKEDVGAWVRALETAKRSRTGRPLSPKSIKNIHGVFSAFMRAATETTPPLRPDNPAHRTKLPRPDRDEDDADKAEYLTHAEFDLLLPYVESVGGAKAHVFVTMLVYTGLRYSEATALRIKDVDLLAGKLTVRRAWKRQEGSTYALGPPKSKRSRRTIRISANVAHALAEHVVDRQPDDLLFPSKTGGHWRNSNFWEYVWQPAVALANGGEPKPREQGPGRKPRRWTEHTPAPEGARLGKWPRPHDLRHTHASWLLDAGMPIAKVSRRLGHDSVLTTERVYWHLLPDGEDELVEALESMAAPTPDDIMSVAV